MGDTVVLPKEEYDALKRKADLFDHLVENEELTKEELASVENAMKGPFLTKSEFLKRHRDIA